MDLRSRTAGAIAPPADEYSKSMLAAVAAERERRPFDARQLYLAAANAKPGDATALEGAARAAFLAKDNVGAIEHLRAGVKANPHLMNVTSREYSILDAPTRVTHGLPEAAMAR